MSVDKGRFTRGSQKGEMCDILLDIAHPYDYSIEKHYKGLLCII